MMDTYFNYLIEANAGLCFFALLYALFLKNETDFHAKRIMLLCGILFSLLFPLFSFENENLSSLNPLVPTVWLPEISLTAGPSGSSSSPAPSPLAIISYVYAAGIVFFLMRFLWDLSRIMRVIRKSRPVRRGRLMIAQTTDSSPCFSFFNFIVLGNSELLSEEEREQIISHERIHVARLHSMDILLLNITGIFFWFNPVLRLYKNIFIQLHEFEADSRAVKNESLNDYCSLLARVALLSADLRIANHFSNSLTLKRIEMMRRIKMKIKPWRVLAVAVAVPVLFFAVSCNDEALSEVSDIAKDSHMALNVPAHVQERLDFLIKNNPDKKYIMIEMGSTGNQTLQELQERYGLPGSVEVFKDNAQPMRAEAEAGVILKNEDSVPKAEKHGFIILEYDQNARKLSELSRDKDVFTIVDETASFPGGMTEFYKLMSKNLRYPEDAKANGIEGKVFVEFIVEKDGSVSEVAVKKGLYESIDTEAVRAMMLSPKWNPGKQNGKPVRQRLVLPLSFSTGKEALLKKATSVMDILYPIPPIRLKEDNC